jgi:hypothetical protein
MAPFACVEGQNGCYAYQYGSPCADPSAICSDGGCTCTSASCATSAYGSACGAGDFGARCGCNAAADCSTATGGGSCCDTSIGGLVTPEHRCYASNPDVTVSGFACFDGEWALITSN